MDKPYSQLILTKLRVPKLRSRIINRRRLLERATAEPGAVLTLVSAPAGYGKTTLLAGLAQDLAHSGTPIAWYSLDSNDNDSRLFGSYLVASLSEALELNSALMPVVRLLHSSTEINLEKVLVAIINAVASSGRDCLLVFDDCHVISSPAIYSALTFLFDHLPENMQVIIGSRSDPLLPLARLRARHQLVEIRAVDLRFTQDEATEFLNQTMQLSLSLEAISEIEARTEGWITGLQLAALSITGRVDRTSVVSSLFAGNRYLVEYLLQEVIERQPQEIQLFLFSTSVLERMCAPLCDAILGSQTRSENILSRLEQENLFIVSLDEQGYWFRYHHLFRDFMLNQLTKSAPDRIPLLHRAASEWYVSQDLLREAVSHAFETKDWNYAAEVVERLGSSMLMRSEVSIVQKWCELFPEQNFLTHPKLCIIQARILILSYKEENRSRIEDLLQKAEQVALSLEDKQTCRSLTAQAAGVRAFLGLIPAPAVDLNQERSLAQRALDLLSTDDPLRSTTLLTVGYIQMATQDVSAARKTMEEVRRSSLDRKNYYGVIEATFELACFALYQGQFEHAKEICREGKATITALIANPEQELPAVGCLDIVRGCILLEENQLPEAEQSLLHGLDLIGWTINPYYRLTAYIALFQLREIQGKATEAVRLLNDLEEDWPDIGFCTQGLKVMHLMRTVPKELETLVQAEKWSQAFSYSNGENMSVPGMGPIGAAQTYYLASLIWVQARILLGKPEETLMYLERQQKLAEAQGLVHRLIELYLAESLARRTLMEDKSSYETLGHALALAKSAGCLRIFNLGPEFVPSLKEATVRGIVPSYAELILKTIGAFPGFNSEQPQTSGLSNMNVKGLGSHDDQLTERELEVLRLMASGASTQEIAGRFVVTTGTVKSHVNHILSKLDVHSRLEAVARARELGLLKI